MHVKSPKNTVKHHKICLFAKINRTIIEHHGAIQILLLLLLLSGFILACVVRVKNENSRKFTRKK